MKFPDKKYQIIYADPPWSYEDRGCRGATTNHYPAMDIRDIQALPVSQICDKNCILFLWATFPMLAEALAVIDSWGFTYKTMGFLWIKQNKLKDSLFYGLGRWTRGNPEPCLLGIKGKPKRVSCAVRQLLFHPLGRHSQKPPEVRDKIVELVGNLPRIEMFARERVNGWDAWGNEVRECVGDRCG